VADQTIKGFALSLAAVVSACKCRFVSKCAILRSWGRLLWSEKVSLLAVLKLPIRFWNFLLNYSGFGAELCKAVAVLILAAIILGNWLMLPFILMKGVVGYVIFFGYPAAIFLIVEVYRYYQEEL